MAGTLEELRLDEDDTPKSEEDIASALTSWVMGKMKPWEDHRKSNYDTSFDQYWDIYCGKFRSDLQLRRSERSKLVSPASQQAVDNIVAEISDTFFGDPNWLELAEEVRDQNGPQDGLIGELLQEDMEDDGAIGAFEEVIELGAIYGTGLMKMAIQNAKAPLNMRYIPIDPTTFVIDPAAANITDAMGCGTITNEPAHTIHSKINTGMYRDVDINAQVADPENKPESLREESAIVAGDDATIEIHEYHGLVPANYIILLEALKKDPTFEVEPEFLEWKPGDEMMESVVIIANESKLLKAFPNFLSNGPDEPNRMIFAHQHFTVSRRFWGRGVIEKALNSQRALDAELRARMDNMALQVAPQMGINAGEMAFRGQSLAIKPGKVWLMNSDPSKSLFPFKMGNVDSTTFPAAGDFERMVQMSSGAVDTATPIGQNPRNETASGMSMIQSSVMKRSKRTMRNISRGLIIPAAQMTFRLNHGTDKVYQDVSQGDDTFRMVGTLGIQAREIEQQQLVQVMQIVDVPAVRTELVKGFIGRSTLPNRQAIIDAVSQASQPDPEKLQKQKTLEAIQMKLAELSVVDAVAEIEKTQSETAENMANAEATDDQTIINSQNMAISALKTANDALKT